VKGQREQVSVALWVAAVTLLASVSASEPTPQQDRAVPGARVVLRGVEFGFDTAFIDPVSRTTLELVAEELARRPGIRVRIDGHTCEMGSAEYNRELSEQRAEAVKRILVGYGIPADRLETAGRGEAEPVADNQGDEGRALNRRVELVILEVE
jgi:OOP family OmpA-OmpF porin